MLDTIFVGILVGLGGVVGLIGIRQFLYYFVRRNWRRHDPQNEESVEGKVVLITGANTGIGKITAQEMAKRGATVVLACRNVTSAANAVVDIRGTTRNGNMTVMKLDLSSFESVRKFAEKFQKRFDKLHILINNAGILTPIRHGTKSKDGLEIHFATNHLGHFLLTNLLLDQIKAAAPSKILTLSSSIHVKGEIDFEDLMGERKNYRDNFVKTEFPLYSNSKLANALFSQELGRRLRGTNVRTYAVDPGDVVTDITRTMDLPFLARLAFPLLSFLLKTPEEGTQTTLYCALSRDDDVASKTGEMYQNCAIWDPATRITLDDDVARRLWDASEKLVGVA